MSRYVQLPDVERTIIVARYPSRCITCSAPIREGSECAYAAGHGVLCMRCLRRGERPTWRGARLVRASVRRPTEAEVALDLARGPRGAR